MIAANGERSAYRTTGYQMINSVQIKNFRSFDQAALDDCRRINIIVGENGSGKTALLEGIFLAAGPSPEIALRTRAWRGIEGERFSGTLEQVDRALWADLFHKFQTKKLAEIFLRGDVEHNRSVEITFNERTVHRVPNREARRRLDKKSRRGGVVIESNPNPIKFRWQVPGRQDVIVYPHLEGGEIKIPPVPQTHVPSAFFPANRTYSGIETANRFSQLSRTFREDEFIEMFHTHFKSITDVSVEVSAGMAMLFARVDDIPEKIPLSLASGGMNKMAAILLAIPAQPGGIVLVDEIENGVYYRRMPLIWQSLLDLTRKYDSQVFVSTHSGECIEAAADIAAKNPDDFSVIRTVIEGGASKIRHISGNKFAAALEQRLDIR